MKPLRRLFLVATFAGVTLHAAQAETLFGGSGGTAWDNFYFDINTAGTQLSINTFTISSFAVGTFHYRVYTHTGTRVGTEANGSAWTLVSLTTITTSNANVAGVSPFTIPVNVVVPANSTQAFVILTEESGDIGSIWTGNAGQISSADLTVPIGLFASRAVSAGFFDTSAFPGPAAGFGGTIIYTKKYVDPIAPTIAIRRDAAGAPEIVYTGTLESATTANGSYQPVPGATNPHQPNVQEAAIRFYRAKSTPAAVRAFPEAQGYGAGSVGGRGGRVIEVTNLNDSGPGSFRDAVLQTGPRTVVFKVGGTIDLLSDINISGAARSYLTIAGQTAPGGGIQSRLHGLAIRDGAHDIIVRYLRHRRGWIDDINGRFYTGFIIANDDETNPVYNIIVDHCSFGWQQDDNGAWARVHDVTYQRNIFAEANPDGTGNGGKGMILAVDPGSGSLMRNISVHHNYLASNAQRNPLIGCEGPTEVVNNVIYNWQSFGAWIQSRGTAGAAVNYVGNYFKAGPDTWTWRYEMAISGSNAFGVLTQPPQMVYVQDNIGPHRTSSNQAEWALMGFGGGSTPNGEDTYGPASTSFQRGAPWPPSANPITVASAFANVATVLNNVGASQRLDANGNWVSNRDALDTRLVNEYNTGTGSVGGDNNWPVLAPGTPYIDTDHDGMPDVWETAHALNPNNGADRNTSAANGYTNLENFLNGL
jgi:pectate lyase